MNDYHFWLNHFINASLLAKIIYSILAFLSISAWAIIIRKLLLLRRTQRGSRAFLELYRKGRRDLPGLYRHVLVNEGRYSSPQSMIFLRGCEELQATFDRQKKDPRTTEERKISAQRLGAVSKTLEAVQDTYFLKLEHLLIHLATTISVAPFLGLLGTVWGILVAFQDMGQQASTGMTAFGPGISEALISTVSGLIVAIPALLGYNYIGSRIRELAGDAAHFATEFVAAVEKNFLYE